MKKNKISKNWINKQKRDIYVRQSKVDGYRSRSVYKLQEIDEKKKTFVEPYLPNYKIGIMHLAAGIWKDNKDMRLDKTVKIDIETLENTTITKSLRFGQ